MKILAIFTEWQRGHSCMAVGTFQCKKRAAGFFPKSSIYRPTEIDFATELTLKAFDSIRNAALEYFK